MKKNMLCLLVVLAMLTAMLAGCGSSSTSDAAASTDNTASSETTVSEAEEEPAEDETAETPAENAEAEESEAAETTEAEPAEEPEEPAEEASGEMTAAEQLAAVAAMEIDNPHSLPLTEDDVSFTLWTDFIPPLFNYMPNGNADNMVYEELEKRTGVHMDITSTAIDSASTTVSLIITSGDYPDIWYGFSSYYGNSMDQAVEEDLIYNFADYKEYLPCFFSIIDSYDIYKKTAYTDQGTLGVLNGIWTNSSIDAGLTIRQDWLDELGLDIPTTLEEFHDVLTQFHNTYGAVYYMTEFSSDPVNTFAQCFGVAGYSSDTASYAYYIAKNGEEVQFSPLLDSFKDYLTTMNEWYNEGLFYPDFLNASDSTPSTDIMLDGTIGLTYYTISNYSTLLGEIDEGSSFQLSALDVPVNVETGEPVHLGREPDYASAKGYSLSTNLSPDSDEFRIALEWMDYHYTDEGTELCNFGVEGVTFTYGENGEHIWTELMTDNPSGLAYSWCLNCYTFGAGSFRIDSNRTMENYGDQEMALMDVWNNSETDGADNLPGAISLTTDESYEYSAMFGDINTHVHENILAFITGSRDLSEYDTFVEEVKSMGIDDCTAILQTALERYNER